MSDAVKNGLGIVIPPESVTRLKEGLADIPKFRESLKALQATGKVDVTGLLDQLDWAEQQSKSILKTQDTTKNVE